MAGPTTTILQPASFAELADAVRAVPRVLAVGAGTKPRLSAVDTVKLSTAGLRGISEYDPSEFTFTAAAGTPVWEIAAALAERGQYLPFDPVLAEITFKVFPRPAATRTLRLDAATLDDAVLILTAAALTRFEFDALDLPPGETGVLARMAAPTAALDALSREVLARWPGAMLSDDDAQRTWTELREFRWCAATAPLVKVALAPAKVSPLGLAVQALAGARMHVSAGGNVAFVALADAAQAPAFDAQLRQLALPGMTLRGAAPLWLGTHAQPAITAAVKVALDPVGRFPELSVP